MVESRFVGVNINSSINLFVSFLPFLIANVDVGTQQTFLAFIFR